MTRRADATTVLSLYLLLLTAIPSQLTFAPLGGAGSPARILGLLCLGWWIYEHVQRSGSATRQPVRIAFFVLLFFILISYVVATTREMPGSESNTALIGLVLTCSFGGSLLVAADGIQSFDRLFTLQRRIVLAGAFLAGLACFQFATGEALVDKLSIPGLTNNTPLYGVASRDGMNRPSATAIHPIELGMVLTMVLPLALNLALVDRSRSGFRRWAPALLILVATVLCISRSAIIGMVIGVTVIALQWPAHVRRGFLLLSPFFVGALFLTVPGLLGTLGGLFTSAGGDSSVQSRTGSYAIAWEFIHRSPLVGRGFGTFLPQYRILDNQYLLLLIEIGILGLLAFLALMVAGIMSARRYRLLASNPVEAQLAQGLMASITVGTGCLAFFDGISFPIGSGLLFLLIGVAGAGARLARGGNPSVALAPAVAIPSDEPIPRPTFTPVPLPIEPMLGALLRRWYVSVAGLALTVFGAVQVMQVPGVYWTQTEVVFLIPKTAKSPNTLDETSSGVIATAGLVALDVGRVVGAPTTASAGVHLPGMGVRAGSAVQVPDTGGQWSHNYERPLVAVEVVGPSKEAVDAKASDLVAQVQADLVRRQREDGTAAVNWITSSPSPGKVQTFYLSGQLKRAAAVVLVLGTWSTLLLVAVADTMLRRRRRPDPPATIENGDLHAVRT